MNSVLLCRRVWSGVLHLLAVPLALALPDTAAAQSPGIPVTTRPLAEIVVVASKSAPAEVVPANRTTLAAQIPARIAGVAADVGAAVRKGDLLIRLETRDYTLALRRAEGNLASLEAQIKKAETQLRRAETLASKQYVSEDEILTLTTNLAVLRRNADVQRVEVDIAQLNLERTRITAPFDGVIETRDAQEGAYVVTGGPLLTLTQTSNREISADLFPDLVASLSAATSIKFNGSGGTFTASILRISEIVDPDSRTQTVRLRFDDAEAPVGATGTIEWSASGGLIPTHLIVQRGGSLGIFVADRMTARFHVLPGASEGRAAQHDLPPDTELIVEGRARLQDGDRIEQKNK